MSHQLVHSCSFYISTINPTVCHIINQQTYCLGPPSFLYSQKNVISNYDPFHIQNLGNIWVIPQTVYGIRAFTIKHPFLAHPILNDLYTSV